MNPDQIKAIQTKIGTAADGEWGPKSKAACQAYLRSLMPNPNPWPSSDPASLNRYFGNAGDESILTPMPLVGLGIQYDGAPVKVIRCNKLVAASLHRVLEAIAAGPHADILTRYAGCYNYRVMRGGSSLSCHAWGVAIDLDPDNNGNLTPWPKVATMPFEVIEAFAREGWLSAGAFWGRDGMHFQATR